MKPIPNGETDGENSLLNLCGLFSVRYSSKGIFRLLRLNGLNKDLKQEGATAMEWLGVDSLSTMIWIRKGVTT